MQLVQYTTYMQQKGNMYGKQHGTARYARNIPYSMECSMAHNRSLRLDFSPNRAATKHSTVAIS